MLCNGEEIAYTKRKKRVLREELQKKQELMIAKLSKKKLPLTEEEYRRYYKLCDDLPFAFTDIEMVFNEEKRAVDWIFRYGNEALAVLEKLPLDKLIGSSFFQPFFLIWMQNGFVVMNVQLCMVKHWKSWITVLK